MSWPSRPNERRDLARRSVLALGVAALALSCAPAASAGDDFAEGMTETPWIPFDFFNDNRIFLPLKVNGRETTALLDSGAASTILDQGFATELDLPLRHGGVAQGIAGGVPLQVTDGVTIEIGGVLTLTDRRLGVIDMAGVARSLGRPLPVVLGREVFNEYVVDIDFPNRRIAFRRKEGFTPLAEAARLPVSPLGALYSVPISVEEGPEGQAILDLGNGTPLVLSRDYVEAHGLLNDRRTSTALAGGVGGMLTQQTMTLRSVTIAAITFTDVPGAVFDTEPRVMERGMVGNLGLPILSRFRATADFSSGVLYLTPGPATRPEPFPRNRAGLFVRFQGDKLLVQHVAAGSPAEGDGWREGDVITAINGEAIEATYPGSSLSRWRLWPPGTVVILGMASGPDRTLVLEDYY